MSRLLWLDTDLALGTPAGDVDDGFALAAVLAAPGARLLGISSVAGNTDAKSAETAIRRLVEVSGLKVPVFGQAAAATEIASLPAGARIVALGPLTNIIRAVALDAGLPSRVSISVVATVLRPWRHPLWGFFCLNTRADRCSARTFFEMPWPGRKVFPLDVVSRLRCGRPELDQLASSGPLAAYLAAGSRRWLRQVWWRYSSRRFPVWDLVAALEALGELPDATFTADGRLLDFDAAAAWARFVEGLDQPQGPPSAGKKIDLR